MNVKELEDKGYVASNQDIEEITQSALDANALMSAGRATYLRVLIGTTQQQLGIALGRRRSVPPPMDEAETARQLSALETVQDRFYPIVMKIVEGRPLTDDERSLERRLVYARRATFARTAKATIRAWILSGNNMKGLTASKATKYGLQAEIVKRRSPAQARAPSERFLDGVTRRLIERVKSARSSQESIKLLEHVISQLVSGLVEMGVETTTKLEEAVAEGKLWQTQTGIVFASRAPTPERQAEAA